MLFKICVILLTFATLSGCKRGEEDPFISLRSRDSRITGTWVLKNATLTSVLTTSISGSTNAITYSVSYENGILTEISQGTVQGSSIYSREMTLEKDGTYNSIDTNDGYSSEESGNWWWLNDSKNKTRLAFDNDPYLVEQLKNKELILSMKAYCKETEPNGDWEEETEDLRMVFEKK